MSNEAVAGATINAELDALIDSKFREFKEGSIVNGTILDIRPQVVIIDVGYKSEGVIPSSEFEDDEIEEGDEVEVLLERLENDEGMVVLSKEKAAHKQNWDKIVKVFEDGGLVKGKVKSVVKGGLMVNVGVEAFLPGSQVDIIPPKDLNEFVGNIYEFKIVKVNDERQNIVLSRREVIEAERSERRQRFLQTVKVGDKVTGQVKNLTDFGAFVDLEGMDGLLHITDMSWGRINHPSEMLRISQEIEVQILDVDREKERVSLGLKQMTDNPWEDIEAKFPIGSNVKGRITKLLPYGAFVELEEGIDGMVHVSDMSWTRKVNHPSEVLKKGDEVDAIVLDVDTGNQRISLGMKQLAEDPWEDIDGRFRIGDVVTGIVSKTTSFGAFVELQDHIDGLVHISQISEDRVEKIKDVLNVGDEVTARVIKIDRDERRIGLSIKGANYDDEQLAAEAQTYDSMKEGGDLMNLGDILDQATK